MIQSFPSLILAYTVPGDPIPFPLATEKRVAFQAPNARSHLLPEKRSIQRYGAKARSYSIGITPRTLSIPPVFPSGDPADW
ncbi:hypothetical protein BaRGS_00032826 [Batillaria attramentaria]|uniref:Uncharacterized protein n=1 Tax=Batillaria attramentaria TaxID=370345 RepID=A0ABD0JN66_9CAEN